MRIAYFTDTYLPEVNGVTNTLKQLTLYLEQRNTEHIFFAPDYDGGGKSCAAGNRVRRFPGIRVSLSPNSCLAFPRAKTIFDLCDEFTPDLVHVTTEFGIGYRGMKYALSRRLPLVMSCHTDYCNYQGADLVMIAVATPDRRDGSADLSYLYGVCRQILVHVPEGCLVLVKSTAPVGTCSKVQEGPVSDGLQPGISRPGHWGAGYTASGPDCHRRRPGGGGTKGASTLSGL